MPKNENNSKNMNIKRRHIHLFLYFLIVYILSKVPIPFSINGIDTYRFIIFTKIGFSKGTIDIFGGIIGQFELIPNSNALGGILIMVSFFGLVNKNPFILVFFYDLLLLVLSVNFYNFTTLMNEYLFNKTDEKISYFSTLIFITLPYFYSLSSMVLSTRWPAILISLSAINSILKVSLNKNEKMNKLKIIKSAFLFTLASYIHRIAWLFIFGTVLFILILKTIKILANYQKSLKKTVITLFYISHLIPLVIYLVMQDNQNSIYLIDYWPFLTFGLHYQSYPITSRIMILFLLYHALLIIRTGLIYAIYLFSPYILSYDKNKREINLKVSSLIICISFLQIVEYKEPYIYQALIPLIVYMSIIFLDKLVIKIIKKLNTKKIIINEDKKKDITNKEKSWVGEKIYKYAKNNVFAFLIIIILLSNFFITYSYAIYRNRFSMYYTPESKRYLDDKIIEVSKFIDAKMDPTLGIIGNNEFENQKLQCLIDNFVFPTSERVYHPEGLKYDRNKLKINFDPKKPLSIIQFIIMPFDYEGSYYSNYMNLEIQDPQIKAFFDKFNISLIFIFKPGLIINNEIKPPLIKSILDSLNLELIFENEIYSLYLIK